MKKLGTKLANIAFRLRNRIALSNKRYEQVAERISELGERYRSLERPELLAAACDVRERHAKTRTEETKVELLAIAREVAEREIGLRPYDVQLVAAMALGDKKCVEMYTGEGKTLAAVLTCCLEAPFGHGVHVLTFNDYLAGRDAQWMGPIFEAFGMTVGFVQQGMSPETRRAAYQCDVTYVTAKEAAFDYLRDQNCESAGDHVHRGFHFAIVDEADSSLIDEARIPMVLATEDERDDTNLQQIANLIRTLRAGQDYSILSHGRNCSFTDSGIANLERTLNRGELHDEANIDLLSRLNVALHAEVLLRRDVDYIVRDGAIELIDEFTGRVAENRRWPGGIQAALEAKENLDVQPQGRILNSITMQYFLERYDHLAGMSGTAQESTGELDEFYDLKVVIIPPNRPNIRIDHPDRVFLTRADKFDAIVREILFEHDRGRPVLVGTASVEESEELARQLRKRDVVCRVLNAANDYEEAEIVAEAGALRALTISTNMAGRGTDIRLGGSKEIDREHVVELGGLYVVGTNRHESRRIDNQLRGRAARQGDPGETRFFVSLEDDLLIRFGVKDLADSNDAGPYGQIENPEVAARVAHLQRVIEGQSFEIRKTLRKYAFLLERQRRRISERRSELLSDFCPEYLHNAEPEFYEQLTSTWGKEHVASIERQVALRHMERCWSDHLEYAAQIRESIHLASLGGFNAFDEFNREMNREFRTLHETIADRVVRTMKTATITADGIDQEGLKAPSSTWTYMISDNPRGGVLDQLTKGIVRMVRGWLK